MMIGARKRRLVRATAAVGAGLLLTGIAALVVWRALGGGAGLGARLDRLRPDASDVPGVGRIGNPSHVDPRTESQIAAFCGDCHAVPRPEGFPRDRWHNAVRTGYEHYARSGRNDLEPPPIAQTVAYYRSRAPERLVFAQPAEAQTALRATFAVEKLDWGRKPGVQAATSHLRWCRLKADEEPVLLVCDMRDGTISAVDLQRRKGSGVFFHVGGSRSPARMDLTADMEKDSRPLTRVLARLNHPCHVEPCDLDGSGAIGLVVADLGSFSAVDHALGRVVWLRPPKGSGAVGWDKRSAGPPSRDRGPGGTPRVFDGRGARGSTDETTPFAKPQGVPPDPRWAGAPLVPPYDHTFDQVVLASGLGRVADVRPVDVDGDGDLDLIVAEFGHDRTGGILLLRNIASRGQPPRFATEKLDLRTGTIHVPACDLNADGRPDFVALVSNENESVDVFLNQGKGRFRRQTLWQGPDLTFGSSGIELVDLDRDGDVDILYTNGDSFDNLYANPSHGVQWLENLGAIDFAYHRLADLPGAYCARAGDLDGDGDLDIVVASWLPQQVMPAELRQTPLASILCLEQISPGRFARHTLETGAPHHATMEMADFDDDGDLDFAVGFNAGLDGASTPAMPRLAVWWNGAKGK